MNVGVGSCLTAVKMVLDCKKKAEKKGQRFKEEERAPAAQNHILASTHLLRVLGQRRQFAQQAAPAPRRVDEVHFHLFGGGRKWEGAEATE